MLLSRNIVLKGTFFPAKHFHIYVFFEDKKLLLKIYTIPWSILSKFNPPFKSTVIGEMCHYADQIRFLWPMLRGAMICDPEPLIPPL